VIEEGAGRGRRSSALQKPTTTNFSAAKMTSPSYQQSATWNDSGHGIKLVSGAKLGGISPAHSLA
jgi:hypothetical protein